MWVYIWNDTWLPNKNTVAYFPFENDTLDHSWKWTIVTASWTPTKSDIWYWFSWWTYIKTTLSESSLIWTLPYTIIMWAKWVSWTTWLTNYSPLYTTTYYSWWTYSWSEWRLWSSNVFYTSRYWSEQPLTLNWSDSTKWNLLVFVLSWNSQDIYQNWQLIWQWTASYRMSASSSFSFPSNSSDSWRNKGTRLSNVIIENTPRTAEQVAWYYNQTKSQYWIS